MPTIEAITPQENRDFLTSLGDWTGDGTWMESSAPEIYSWMRFDTEEYEEQKTGILQYPHISPKPNYTHRLKIRTQRQNTDYEGAFSWKITDGVYTLEGSFDYPPHEISWPFEEDIDIPNDWNTENTSLQVTFESLYDGDAYWLCSRFSLEYYIEAKIQYLPIMGVG